MKILGIIPSRYGSTRFPGKPLIEIDGKSMVQRVYEQAQKCEVLNEVVVATDDQRIFDHVLAFGGKAMMTSDEHQSGTDRCNEVVQKINKDYNIVINIQGDEPYINPEQIAQLCSCFLDDKTEIATLIKKIDNDHDLFDENKVKVVTNKNHFALYFSRNSIPFLKGENKEKWRSQYTFYKHIGIYGYRTKVLSEITQLSVSKLEKAEGLEQLRWLENGYSIKTAITNLEAISIDSPEDLKKLKTT